MSDCSTNAFKTSGKKRKGHIVLLKSGPLYDKYRYTCCGWELAESKCDSGYSGIPNNFCPNCGAEME